MKKIFSVLAIFLLGLVLVSCGGKKTYEVAMITDTGDIDDGSFNEGTWKGIKDYTENKENYVDGKEITHQYYKPAGETIADYSSAIDLAVKGGAKIVITPGYYFETPIFEAQKKYPEVKFVLLDGSPHNGKEGDANEALVATNTVSIFFHEEEAGFLAGYATVKEGYTKLGFMGGVGVPAVQRFGIGWVAGAYQAAKDLDIPFEFQAAHYDYLGTFGANDDIKTKAATWYQQVDVIHAAAGGAGLSVMAAASDLQKKWVVGVDSDQAGASTTVLSSAMKGVREAATDILKKFYTNKFPGGTTMNLGAETNAVGLPMATSRFENFKQADYDTLFAKVKNKTIIVPATADALEAFVNALKGTTYKLGTGLKAKI